MPKTRYLVRPQPRLQKLQREIRKQFGTYKSTYLTKVDGAIRLPGGLFWVHDPTGVDANGNTTYGAPRKMPMLPGAAIFPRPNTKVDVVTIQGIDYIARTNSFELERMGVDPHQSNTLDPVVQYKALDWIINLQAFKTPGASSTHIIGSIYKKPDGDYAVFPTTGGYDFVTANLPSTDNQVVVCQWIDTDTNTVTATVSSEESRDTDLKHPDNIATTLALINECVAAAPANHIGVNAWRVYDDSTIGTMDDNNKLADLRGIVGGAAVSSGSLDVTDGVTTVTGATAIEFTSGATVTDNAGVAEVAISGSSYYQTIRNNGSAQTQRGKLNAIPGTNITFSFNDDAGNDETEWTINSTAAPGGGAPPSICEGRATLTSGTPVTTGDVTGATNIYWTPYKGSYIGVYSGSAWELLTFSELTLSLSGLVPHSIHDVFGYNNTGSLALERTAWTAGATGAITGATNATPIAITSTAHGLSTGDIVTISGVGGNTAANGTFRITNTGANTFSLQTMAANANVAGSGAYTSGGDWYKANYTGTRATALTTQNGIDVKSGDATRRYLFSFQIGATAGQVASSVLNRQVINRYNTVPLPLAINDSTDSWNYSTATLRPWNNSYNNRARFLLPTSETYVELTFVGLSSNSAAASNGVGIGLDSTTARGDTVFSGAATSVAVPSTSIYRGYPGVGAHYFQLLEVGGSTGTTTFYGDAGLVNVFKTGASGVVWG